MSVLDIRPAESCQYDCLSLGEIMLRLDPGDGMPVHADGRRYHGTVSLGLCDRWRAAQGGAIAMGAPVSGRFEVHRRWLPHLGDLLLFAPTRTSWHAVEPVVAGRRLSVTAWWTAP